MLMCAFSILLTTFLCADDVKAAEPAWTVQYTNPTFISPEFEWNGYKAYNTAGYPDSELPSGVATVRIPLDLFRVNEGNLQCNLDYVYIEMQEVYLYVVDYVSQGQCSVEFLTADLVGASQSFPVTFNMSNWASAVFDLSVYHGALGNFFLNDMFYLDVTFKYQIYGDYLGNGSYTYSPAFSCKVEAKIRQLKIQGFNKNDELYNQLFKDDGSLNDFKQNSSSQSSKLDSLNQQNKVDKVNIDTASGTVDDYIDDNAISNYGVVLSTFTGNAKVLQMLLIVLAVGLVSYVLFGKR